jgi:5-methylcytosine-specific restriction endonuclease McrA
MKSYISIYFDHFGYDESDFINCELCSSKAVDIHHINARGMAGSKNKDTIDNLMAVCRICHIKFGDKKMYIDFLKEKHNEVLEKFKRNK